MQLVLASVRKSIDPAAWQEYCPTKAALPRLVDRKMRKSRPTARLAIAAIAGAMCLAPAAATTPQTPTPQAAVFMQRSHSGGPVQCSDAFSAYLPGLVNFCHGVRAWERGRYADAIGWLKLAARWGSKGAQYTLGLMYYNGDHVTSNAALGLAWLKLANERHDNPQIEVVTRSANQYATRAQRERADELFQTMRKRYGDKVAAQRAWNQFKHQKELAAYQMGGGLAVSTDGGCVYVPAGQDASMGRPLQSRAPLSPKARKTHPSSTASGTCVTFYRYNGMVANLAHHYFKGWSGRVTVEPLQQLPTSSAATK